MKTPLHEKYSVEHELENGTGVPLRQTPEAFARRSIRSRMRLLVVSLGLFDFPPFAPGPVPKRAPEGDDNEGAGTGPRPLKQ